MGYFTQRKNKKRNTKLLFFIITFLLLCSFLGFNSEKSSFYGLINEYRPQYVLISLFLMLFSPFYGRWFTHLFSSLILIINLVVILSSSNLFVQKNKIENTDEIITTYYHNDVVSEYDVLMQIKHHNPDIFIYTNKNKSSDGLKTTLLAKEKGFKFIDIVTTKKQEEMVFASKYETLDSGHIPLNNVEGIIGTWATYDINSKVFTLIAVSMPKISELYKSKNKDLIRYLQDFIISRDEPVVILGDFSSSPWSGYLRRLKIKTRIKHKSGQTLNYPSSLPWFLRLSNFSLFAHNGIKIQNIKTGVKSDSKYIPVISNLAISKTD